MLQINNKLSSSRPNQPVKGNVSIVNIKSIQDCKVSIENDQLIALLALKGQATYLWKSKIHQLQGGSGIIFSQLGVPKIISLADSFEGFLIKIESGHIQKILSLIKYKPKIMVHLGDSNQLLLPMTPETDLFFKSLELYFCNSAQALHSPIYESKLVELFWILSNSKVKSEFEGFIHQFLMPDRTHLDSIIEKHFKENISLSQLASIAGYSISTFKRKFEETYQCSPGKWIQNRRLMEAHFLLEITNKTISEIGYEVGFENPSHFIQAFKSKFGTTPKRLQHNKTAA